MLKRILLVLLLAAFVAVPVAYAYKNERVAVMALTEVATGTPVSVTLNNVGRLSGYLIVKTENETAAASMVVTFLSTSALGDTLLCTSSPITTDTTTTILFGLDLSAAEGVTDACAFPATRSIKVTFTTSGAGADFDVTSDIEWLVP